MAQIFKAAALVVVACWAGSAEAVRLPGLPHGIVKVSYLAGEDDLGLPIEGDWLASRFAAICDPDFQVPKVDEATALVQKRDRQAAENRVWESLKDTDRPESQLIIARFFAQTGQVNAARVGLEKVVAAAPYLPETYLLLADIAVREGRTVEADLSYARAAELLAKFKDDAKRCERLRAAVLNGKAELALTRGEGAVAQSHLEELLKVLPDDQEKMPVRAEVMQRLAQAMWYQKHTKEALEKLREAHRLDPANMVAPEVVLAWLYAQYCDRQNAILWMAYAVKYHPEHLPTRLAVAELCLQFIKLEEARTHADKALTITPGSRDAKLMRGIVALCEKDHKLAEKFFEDASRQSPGSFAAVNNLALALCEQDDPAKKQRGRELAEANLDGHAENDEAVATYGRTLYRLGKLHEAREVLRPLNAREILPSDTLYYMACVANDLGRRDEAAELLRSPRMWWKPSRVFAEARALQQQLEGKQKRP